MGTGHIDAKTTVCAVIGNPVEHSLSPAIHNAAFTFLGLNWAYVAFNVTDIGNAIKGIRALNIRGVSVTIPHKVSAMPLLDTIREPARTIGSINTIVNTDGHLAGLNTDGDGAIQALTDAGCTTEGKKVLLLGSGGAARAIAFTMALNAPPQNLSIMGIVEDEYIRLASDIAHKTSVRPAEYRLSADNLNNILPEVDIIINATPVGMHPHTASSPVPASLMHRQLAVFDIVYNPLKTQLLKDAEAAGCTIIPGIEMFLSQAALQFEIWTGQDAPRDVMRKVLEKHFS